MDNPLQGNVKLSIDESGCEKLVDSLSVTQFSAGFCYTLGTPGKVLQAEL
ncbi:MAG TPA: hypothetical protein VJZ75_05595 [Candidatus Bathyarchaeia archaeon]|nr:hypothetical protein [Candidatus Bathyarchaeia archaeon]